MKHRARLGVSGTLCAVVLTHPAFSAEGSTAEEATTALARSDVVQLDEVVVTAQKRSERLQDVPVSVTSIDAASLAEHDAVQLQDYLQNVPNVSVGGVSSGRTSIVVRGISTGVGNNPTTGITIDDVPFGSSTSNGLGDVLLPDLDPADLDHIEVLRGPQGTLYGASSMGGLVKFVSAAPQLDAFSGRLQLDGNSVDHGGTGYGIRGSANIPLVTDQLAIRASGFYREDAGFIDDSLQGRDNANVAKVYGGHVAALWQIAPAVNLRISALLQNQTASASGSEDVYITGQPVYGDLIHQRLPGTDGFQANVRLYSATLTADLGVATLTSITGYGQSDNSFPQDVSGTFGPFTSLFYGAPASVRINNRFGTNKLSEELRLASGTGQRLEWLGGLFYTREKSDAGELIFPVDTATGAALPVQELIQVAAPTTFKEYAGFGDLTYHFSEQADVTVGARYSRNSQEYDETDNGLLVGGVSTVAGRSDDDSTTYLFTPRYRFSDSVMTYARIATGYRVGGPNSGAPAGVPATFGADKTLNYELGVKSELLERRLSLLADVFYIRWSDIQLRAVDPDNGFSYYANGGDARSQGLEVSVAFTPIAGLKLTGNAGYSDAQLTEKGPNGIYAPDGSQLPGSSNWTGSLAAEGQVPVGDSLNAFGTATVSYLGSRLGAFTSDVTAPRFEIPSYVVVDLQTGVRSDRWTASLFVKNLSDKRGLTGTGALNAISGQGVFYASVIQPRTIGLSVATKF
jgi:iron complex outermembrane receptor protein